MKRIVKIAAIVFASVIAVVLVAIGVLYFAKPGLITAVYRGLILSQEDIEREKIENEEKLVNSINEYGFNLTLDDIEELNKGELSEQQIKDILMGKGTESGVLGETDSENPTDTDVKNQSNSDIENGENSENGTENAGGGQINENSNSATKPSADKTQSKPENNRTDNKGNSGASNTSNKQNTSNTSNSGTSSLSTTSKVEYEEQIADLIAKMYVLKAQFNGKIQEVVSSMIADYKALPKEQRTTSSKSAIASNYLGTISSLEAQCDAQVNAIVTELKAVLKESGSDMSLADSIMKAYAAEKESTKAYYINKYS